MVDVRENLDYAHKIIRLLGAPWGRTKLSF